MNCTEIRALTGPYLDSELDPRACLELERHMAACLDCARLLAYERSANARLAAALNQGEANPELWQLIERQVRATALLSRTDPEERPPRRAEPPVARGCWWQFWAWPARSFYPSLAVVWALMLALRLCSDRSPATPALAPTPLSPEASGVLAEQRRQMRELLDLATASAPRPKPGPPHPQGRRGGGQDRNAWQVEPLSESDVSPA